MRESPSETGLQFEQAAYGRGQRQSASASAVRVGAAEGASGQDWDGTGPREHPPVDSQSMGSSSGLPHAGGGWDGIAEGDGPASELLAGTAAGAGGGEGPRGGGWSIRGGDVFPGPASDVSLVLIGEAICGRFSAVTAITADAPMDLLLIGGADGWISAHRLSTGLREWAHAPPCDDPEIGLALLASRRWVGAAGAPGVARDPESEWRRGAAERTAKSLRDQGLLQQAMDALHCGSARSLLPGAGAVRGLAVGASGAIIGHWAPLDEKAAAMALSVAQWHAVDLPVGHDRDTRLSLRPCVCSVLASYGRNGEPLAARTVDRGIVTS